MADKNVTPKFAKLKNVSDREDAFEAVFISTLADFFNIAENNVRKEIFSIFMRSPFSASPRNDQHFSIIANSKKLEIDRNKRHQKENFYTLLYKKFSEKHGEPQLMDTINDFLKNKKTYDVYTSGKDAIYNNLFHNSLLKESEYVQSRYLTSVMNTSINLDEKNKNFDNVFGFLTKVQNHKMFPILKDLLLSTERFKAKTERVNFWQHINNSNENSLKEQFKELKIVTHDVIKEDFSDVSRIRYNLDELQAINPSLNSETISFNITNTVTRTLKKLNDDYESDSQYDEKKGKLIFYIDKRFMSAQVFNDAFKDAIINTAQQNNAQRDKEISERFLHIINVLSLEEKISKELGNMDKPNSLENSGFSNNIGSLKL